MVEEKTKKSWYKRWWAITLFVIVGLIILISLFSGNDNSVQNKTSSESSSGQETNTESSNVESTESSNVETQQETNTYQSCIKKIFESECSKENLIYTDYSSVVGFITCTDDGVYNLDEIGDDTKYLQVFAPSRILEKKCGTYVTPTNNRLKCQEDFFESQCQKEGLIYTDWSAPIGFITCTDDGIYNLNEIGEESKYKQVYVTSEFVNSKCQ